MGQGGGSLQNKIRIERNDIRRKERVIDREIAMMNFELQTNVRRLKKELKAGNVVNAKYIAKHYSMIKKNIGNLYKMKNQISGLCLQVQMMGSQHEINEAMTRVTHTMKMLNSKMNLESVKNIIREFEGEKMKNEVTSDMIDTMNEGDEQDEETEDEILGKVCDELHISLSTKILEPPSGGEYYLGSNRADPNLEHFEKRLGNLVNNNF